MIYLNSILPFTPTSCEWCLPFRFSNQNFERISHYLIMSMGWDVSEPRLPAGLLLITRVIH